MRGNGGFITTLKLNRGYPGGFPGGYPGGRPGGYPGGRPGGYPGGYPGQGYGQPGAGYTKSQGAYGPGGFSPNPGLGPQPGFRGPQNYRFPSCGTREVCDVAWQNVQTIMIRARPNCNLHAFQYGGIISNIVVIQYNEVFRTGSDRTFNLTCDMQGPGKTVVSSGVIDAREG